MDKQWASLDISYPETFDIRRPVLEAAESLRNRWRVSSDGKRLEVDLALGNYRPPERAIIEFAVNPYCLRANANILPDLDTATRHALVKAIASLFGPGGPGDK